MNNFSIGIIGLEYLETYYYSRYRDFRNLENVKETLNYRLALKNYSLFKKYLKNYKKYSYEIKKLGLSIKKLEKLKFVRLAIFNESKNKITLEKIIILNKKGGVVW